MPLFLVFFLFLFYRILSAAMFDDPLTLWASALTAIVVTVVLLVGGGIGMAFFAEDSDEGVKVGVG